MTNVCNIIWMVSMPYHVDFFFAVCVWLHDMNVVIIMYSRLKKKRKERNK